MRYLTYRDLPNDPDVKQGFTVETVREGSKAFLDELEANQGGKSERF